VITVQDVLPRLGAYKKSGDGYSARCPAHDDQKASLSVGHGRDGGVLLTCHARCTFDEIIRALGPINGNSKPNGNGSHHPPKTERVYPTADAAAESAARAEGGAVVASWRYLEANGAHVFTVFRLSTSTGGKSFRPAIEVPGGWALKSFKGPRPLYRLPEVTKHTGPVYVTEGEKAADAAVSIGLCATTSSGGANATRQTDWSPLAGQDVRIIPDNDKPGRDYATDITHILTQLSPPAKVSLVNLPGLPEKGDIVEYIESKDAQTADEIRASIEALVEDAIKPFPIKIYTGVPTAPIWIMPGLLEAGTCCVVAAEPKAGKTWFTFDLGISLATGRKFLDEWQPKHYVKTLFYSPESGHRARHARLVGLCWGRELDPALVLPSLPFLDARLDMGTEDHAARLAKTIDTTGAQLVVIDPLVSAHMGIDENSAGEVMGVLNPLRDMIAARPHCSMIVVHHTHKQAKNQARSLGLRGSSAIGGWWDTLVTLSRADDDSDGPRRVDIAHRDAAAPEPIGFQLAHDASEVPGLDWFRVDRCEVPDLKTASTGQTGGRSLDPDHLHALKSLVERFPGEFSGGAAAVKLGWNRPKAKRYIDHLVSEGVLAVCNGKLEEKR
jgi:putative DNA primase/helicase